MGWRWSSIQSNRGMVTIFRSGWPWSQHLLSTYRQYTAWLLLQVSRRHAIWGCVCLWPGAHISSLPILGNTGIITNSVVILFICDLDKLLYRILMVISPCWVKHMSNVAGHEYESDSDSIQAIHVRVNAKLEGEVASLEEEVQMLSQNKRWNRPCIWNR